MQLIGCCSYTQSQHLIHLHTLRQCQAVQLAIPCKIGVTATTHANAMPISATITERVFSVTDVFYNIKLNSSGLYT